jgi:hypothetical protein
LVHTLSGNQGKALKTGSALDALGTEVVIPADERLQFWEVEGIHDQVDVAIGALSGAGVADHGGDAAVEALISEGVGRGGADGEAGGVLEEVGEEEGVVG